MPSLVSIVMPVYNGEEYLKEAIDSAIAQTYQDWELIVVDDGSTDRTAKIVRDYRDDRMVYTYQENRGQAAALNRGLDLARGVYVTTLDADDCLTPNSLTDRVAFLDENPAYGVVYANGMYINAAGDDLFRFSDQMPAGVSGDVFDTLIVSPFYGTGASVMIRKSLLVDTQIRYDEEIVWCQDWDFYIRLAEKAQFGYVESLSIRYRIHSTGMTTVMPVGKRLDSLLRLRNKVLHSERFSRTSNASKEGFFFDYLVKDLYNQPQLQELVYLGSSFHSLPAKRQSVLLRQGANEYLLADQNLDAARRWLQRAWSMDRTDPRNWLALALLQIHPALARTVIKAYKARKNTAQEINPFKLLAMPSGSQSRS